ncbi:unnamed protein product [Caenorhabditis bovis]|uniref:Proteasome activator complex subunit 4 C-terminal domain-containing protein n=1 Tax=Caenorhabditis bovis TaxID=2654633 RepID=A0A8S1F5F0_9PELO|nr:unnamed protein product [Caenorhabditis bovis]
MGINGLLQIGDEDTVVVDANENLKKLRDRGFERPNKKCTLLPYFDNLEIQLDKHLQSIVNGLVSVLLTENSSDLIDYMEQFTRYIEDYGLRMKRELLIDLIKLFYEGLIKKDQKATLIKHCATGILAIMKKNRENSLSYHDIALDWKPLYDLCTRVYYGKVRDVTVANVSAAIDTLSVFYRPQDQQQIWEQMQVHISINFSMKTFMELCTVFLTVDGLSADEHQRYGIGVWFDAFWEIYVSAEMNVVWGEHVMRIFSRIAFFHPEIIDWKPYYDVIFTKAIRSLELSLRGGKTAVGDGSESNGVSQFAYFISSTIGGENSCLSHFAKMIKGIEFSMHPLNTGIHVEQIISFFENFLIYFTNRIRRERYREKARKVPTEYYLTDDEIDNVTLLIADPILMLLFSPDASYKKLSSILYLVASLNVRLVAPKLLDHVYSALFAVNEPERLSTTIDALVVVIFELLRDNTNERKKYEEFSNEWIVRMEAERMNWPTFREGSQIRDIESRRITTLRHHAIYILELYVNSIDVNDVNRTEAVLKSIVLICTSIPVIDFSNADQYYKCEMDEDDALLCQLSKRLPIIVEAIFEKILAVICCMAVCAPKDSMNNIGTMNDFVTSDGTEERVFKKSIDECVAAIFAHCGKDATDKLLDRLFEFVSTTHFESNLATEVLSGFITSCIWACPEAWKKFTIFLRNKLKTVFTDEIRKLKEPPPSVLYYAVLTTSIFMVVPSIMIENEELMLEVIELLLSCDSRTAYHIGARGLSIVFCILTCLFPSPHDLPYLRIKQPLEEWNPFEEWGRCYKIEDIKMTWIVPTRKGVGMLDRVVQRFMIPLIDSLKSELSRDDLRKAVHIIYSTFPMLKDVCPKPKSEVLATSFTVQCMPPVSSQVAAVHKVSCDIRAPNGANLIEYLVDGLEAILKCHDPRVCEYVLGIFAILTDETFTVSSDKSAKDDLVSHTYGYLCVSKYGEKVYGVYEAMQTFAILEHLTVSIYVAKTITPPTVFDIRIYKNMIRLGINEYEVVRLSAKGYLKTIAEKIFFCREYLIDEVVAIISDPSSSINTLKGALSVCCALNWTETTNSFIRNKFWIAVLKMKVIDEPMLRQYFEAIASCVYNNSNNVIHSIENKDSPQKRNQKIREIGMRLVSAAECPEWAPYLSDEGIQKQYRIIREWKARSQEVRKEMVAKLLTSYVNNGELHHTREKLARSMVYRCQRESAGVETMKVLVPQLIHEELEQREEAQNELVVWLKYNKPKVARFELKPTNSSKKHLLASGLRPDNLFLAYDSHNLPDTAEKWNKTFFIDKQKGCCRFAKTISVARRWADGPPLPSRELNEAEKVIMEWFEVEENVQKFVELRRHDKEAEDAGVSAGFSGVIKLVIRNFPQSTKIIDNFAMNLDENLKSKKRENQIVAAEIYVGIAAGIKHREFAIQERFWSWIAIRLDAFFDVMSSEAKADWDTAMTLTMYGDLRRRWWLVEKLFEGMRRSNVEEWKQAFRIEMFMLPKWRHTQIFKRIAEIAFAKLPFTVTDTLRSAISKSIQAIAQLREINYYSPYEDLPERFRIDDTDTWIKKFTSNIPQLRSCLASSSTSSSVLMRKRVRSGNGRSRSTSPAQKRKRVSDSVALSTTAIAEKRALIYFRSLLEFLTQYYYNCYHSWTPAIIELLPKLFEFSNEDSYEFAEDACKDVDIIQNSSMLIHEFMSTLWLSDEFIDSILQTLVNTFSVNECVWRTRLAILKFVSVIVYSNFFPMMEEGRKVKIEKLVYEAVRDSSVIVRKEAAKCILLFLNCEYLKTNDEKVEKWARILNDRKESTAHRHGAALALGAIVMAFPFSLPEIILKPLDVLGSASTSLTTVQKTITESLREFRRQHRDDWQKTKEFLGERITYEIENATAPIYYA